MKVYIYKMAIDWNFTCIAPWWWKHRKELQSSVMSTRVIRLPPWVRRNATTNVLD